MPVTALAPQASASANSATFAWGNGRIIAGLPHVKGEATGPSTRSPLLPPGPSPTSRSLLPGEASSSLERRALALDGASFSLGRAPLLLVTAPCSAVSRAL